MAKHEKQVVKKNEELVPTFPMQNGRELLELDGFELEEVVDTRGFAFWRPESDEHDHPVLVGGIVISRHTLSPDVFPPNSDGELREVVSIRGKSGDWSIGINASLQGQVGISGAGGVAAGEYIAVRFDGLKDLEKPGRNPMKVFKLFRQKRTVIDEQVVSQQNVS